MEVNSSLKIDFFDQQQQQSVTFVDVLRQILDKLEEETNDDDGDVRVFYIDPNCEDTKKLIKKVSGDPRAEIKARNGNAFSVKCTPGDAAPQDDARIIVLPRDVQSVPDVAAIKKDIDRKAKQFKVRTPAEWKKLHEESPELFASELEALKEKALAQSDRYPFVKDLVEKCLPQ